MQRRERALDAEGDEDEPRGRSLEADVVERQAARVVEVEQPAGQEQKARQHLDDQVTEARRHGALGAPRPDEKHRAHRHQLPEHEERHEIPGKNRAERAAGVDETGHVLHALAQVQRVDDGDEGADVKQISEEQAQAIHAHRGELEAEKQL